MFGFVICVRGKSNPRRQRIWRERERERREKERVAGSRKGQLVERETPKQVNNGNEYIII